MSSLIFANIAKISDSVDHNSGLKIYSNKNHVIFRKPAGKCGNCGERGEGVITLFDAGLKMAYVPFN